MNTDPPWEYAWFIITFQIGALEMSHYLTYKGNVLHYSLCVLELCSQTPEGPRFKAPNREIWDYIRVLSHFLNHVSMLLWYIVRL